MKQDDKGEVWRAIGAAGGIGFTLASCVVAGMLLGKWLDRQLDSSPWAAMGGIVLGAVSGFWGVYKLVGGIKKE